MQKIETKSRILRRERGLSIVAMSHQVEANPTVLGMAERRQLAPSKRVRETVSKFFCVPELGSGQNFNQVK